MSSRGLGMLSTHSSDAFLPWGDVSPLNRLRSSLLLAMLAEMRFFSVAEEAPDGDAGTPTDKQGRPSRNSLRLNSNAQNSDVYRTFS
jgi:hypothetical protein